jgi:cellulose synthase/poly-beta-1,6-N-acetylglucosamine synthase-like glycosyltransferase
LKVLADNAIDELPEYKPQSPAIGTRTSSARNAFREPARLGDLLVEAGMITTAQLESALAQQSSWGARLGDVLLAMGWVKPLEFYQILAGHFDVSFVNLKEEPADAALFDPTEYADYAKHQYLPWRMCDGILWIVVADPTSAWMEQRWGHRDDVYFVMTSSLEILAELQRVAGAQFSEDAVYFLANFAPEHSARTVVTTNQKFWIVALLAAVSGALWLSPIITLIVLNSLLNGFLLFSFLFRLALCTMSCNDEIGQSVSKEEVAALKDEDLPIYTILVPMYKEPNVLPILAAALKNMDYPKSKLDIKLVLEENDHETIDAAEALGLASIFEIVRVPDSLPKTKPKACNYALRLARGEYLTIYDAEDKPEPDQLKKVMVSFHRMGERTACIQAHLNYFNAEENWLTRMFTLEYSLWFDLFLPALDYLRFPIPLGGTSNHFDLKKLREVGGWDPFNVTEDADLGLRFAASGYHVGVVDSVTYEEANSQVGNWIRQRSRWIKGYIQTWLVNMRHPLGLLHRVGWKGFLSFQLFIGGTIASGLTYPFIVIPFVLWFLGQSAALRPFFPPSLLLVSSINLVAGNSFLIYLSMLAAVKRRNTALLPYALTVPGYWLLQSVAAYKALWQLITNPFYWEKTTHGISKNTQDEIARATGTVD